MGKARFGFSVQWSWPGEKQGWKLKVKVGPETQGRSVAGSWIIARTLKRQSRTALVCEAGVGFNQKTGIIPTLKKHLERTHLEDCRCPHFADDSHSFLPFIFFSLGKWKLCTG